MLPPTHKSLLILAPPETCNAPDPVDNELSVPTTEILATDNR